MASIRKRGESFQITVSNGYNVEGKKIIETTTYTPDKTKTKKQQEKALQEFVIDFERRVKNGKYLNGDKLTLKQFADIWMQNYSSNLAPSSYESYKLNLDTKILPALGHIKLNKLQINHIESFYKMLLEDGVRIDKKPGGYSIGTIKKCYTTLSSILSKAVNLELIPTNPCNNAELPSKDNEIQKNNLKYFTPHQSQLFLEALNKTYSATYKSHTRSLNDGKQIQIRSYNEEREIPTQFKVFFNIALFGGLRCGEILALKWQDINFINNTISITKSVSVIKGEVIYKNTKTKKSRLISMPDFVMVLLKQYKREQYEYMISLMDQWEGDNNLFIQSNGKLMNKSTPNHTFHKIIDKYNATVQNESDKLPHIPLHGLRHTSATLLIAEQVDLKTVSARLGHTQTSTTMNIYAHALRELDEKAAKVFENIRKRNA